MRTRLIPHAEWFYFFERFTRSHPGWPTTLWLLSPRIGAQVEARELPLRGIVSDPLATSISILLGATPGRNVEHPVVQPMKVWLNVAGFHAWVVWHMEHWPPKWLAGRVPRWHPAQSVKPVWSKVTLRQLVVSPWQLRQAPA